MKYYDEGDSSDFFACSANCPKMMARGQEIQKLNEKIREYKDKIKALYAEIRQDNIDIDDWKDTADTLAKRVEELEDDNKKLESLKQHLLNHLSNKEAEIVNLKEDTEKLERENKSLNEFVSPTKVLLIFHDDVNQFELFCNDHEISDHLYDALKQAERRIEELRVENEKLKRENEKLEAQLAVREAPSIWERVVFSYPKDKKISSMELYFQEENEPGITGPSSPITADPNILITPTVTYGSGTEGGDAK